MQIQELTPNGIERFLKGEAVILQVFNTVKNPVERQKHNLELIIATVNDGFSCYECVYLFPDNFPHNKIEFNVVKIKLSQGVVKKLANGNHKSNSPLLTDSSAFAVVTNKVNRLIGSPIPFQEFVKNGKKNAKGNRKIFEQVTAQDDEETDEDQFRRQAQKLKAKMKQKQKFEQQKETSKNFSRDSQSKGYSNNRSNSIPVSISVTNKPVQPANLKGNQSTKAIVKTEDSRPQQRRQSIKPEVKHHEGDHEKIRELFLGIQNFRVVGRLLFIWPIKMITNKKGNQSQLLNLQFGDETGTIMCTVFGDNASRFSTLEVDHVYSITGATVTESAYRGVTELKLCFNDGTKVGFDKTAVGIPTVDKFCLSLKELNQAEKGRVVSVVCLVKEVQTVQFVSKNGNNVKKKILKMFDLDNQIQCDLTLFNDKAEVKYDAGMYALKGVQIDEFQGKKQFKSSLVFLARLLKNHPMNRRMKQTEELTFVSISGNQSTSKKQSISSFYVLNQKCEQLKQGESLWSETICYLKSVRLGGNTKTVYLSCPHCKKKVPDESDTYCQHCKKNFQRPMYRFILNVNLIDDHDNIWAGAYDEAGQILLTLPNEKKQLTADAFVEMTEQQLRQRVQEVRYRQFKIKMVSNKEVYNGEARVKHKIVKILPINFHEEISSMLQKIKLAIGM